MCPRSSRCSRAVSSHSIQGGLRQPRCGRYGGPRRATPEIFEMFDNMRQDHEIGGLVCERNAIPFNEREGSTRYAPRASFVHSGRGYLKAPVGVKEPIPCSAAATAPSPKPSSTTEASQAFRLHARYGRCWPPCPWRLRPAKRVQRLLNTSYRTALSALEIHPRYSLPVIRQNPMVAFRQTFVDRLSWIDWGCPCG